MLCFQTHFIVNMHHHQHLWKTPNPRCLNFRFLQIFVPEILCQCQLFFCSEGSLVIYHLCQECKYSHQILNLKLISIGQSALRVMWNTDENFNKLSQEPSISYEIFYCKKDINKNIELWHYITIQKSYLSIKIFFLSPIAYCMENF